MPIVTVEVFSTDALRWDALTINRQMVLSSMRSKRQALPSACSHDCRIVTMSAFKPAAEAEQAGFRPCKRCRPNATSNEQVQLIARICKLIEASETSPLLSGLATAAGLSQYYLQRLFKEIVGMTPKGYAIAQRASGCVMDCSRVSLSLKPLTLALERVVIF